MSNESVIPRDYFLKMKVERSKHASFFLKSVGSYDPVSNVPKLVSYNRKFSSFVKLGPKNNVDCCDIVSVTEKLMHDKYHDKYYGIVESLHKSITLEELRPDETLITNTRFTIYEPDTGDEYLYDTRNYIYCTSKAEILTFSERENLGRVNISSEPKVKIIRP